MPKQKHSEGTKYIEGNKDEYIGNQKNKT